MNSYNFDLLVIGSGPGGYVAAIRASQLGLKVGLVEKDKPGGVCLNVGCIPSKSLIQQATVFSDAKKLEAAGIKLDITGFKYSAFYDKSRTAADRLSKGVQFLLKKNNIEYIKGMAQIKSKNEIQIDGSKILTAKNILIATGSRPRALPGFDFDGKYIMSSTDMLMLQKLPKSLAIMGSGAIGIEFAYIMSCLGVEVTVIEMMDQILPLEEKDCASVVERSLKKRKVKFLISSTATSVEKKSEKVILNILKNDKKQTVQADMLLVAVGRMPNSEDLGLDKVGIQCDKGFIQVGDYYQTSVPGIFAIGDVIATPLLAHVASKEGEIAVEYMAGHKVEPRLDDLLIPSATYCEPGVASFGLTEKKAKEQKIEYKTFSFPFSGIGKAVATEHTEGFVKILIQKKTSELIGAHIVGPGATELIHELLLAKKSELLPEDIATMVHAHPTLSEGTMEAARGLEGWAIHI